MKGIGLVLALAAVALFAAQASAAQNPFTSVHPGSAGKQSPMVPNGEPPGDPVSLVIDDGSHEDCVGLNGGGQFLWLNRFTPVEYPVGLTQIQTIWDNTTVGCFITIGASFDLFTYRDNNSNPGDGATNVSSHTGQTVTVLNSFQNTTFPSVFFAAGPGDILIGAVNRTGMDGPGQFPAAQDTTASQVRSWIGFTGANPPVPPPVPFGTFPSQFNTVDFFGFPGNWMMRGSSTVVPVELQDFSIQ
jgi:hypothetical protein